LRGQAAQAAAPATGHKKCRTDEIALAAGAPDIWQCSFALRELLGRDGDRNRRKFQCEGDSGAVHAERAPRSAMREGTTHRPESTLVSCEAAPVRASVLLSSGADLRSAIRPLTQRAGTGIYSLHAHPRANLVAARNCFK
jgi:hypothetical protein